MRTVSPTMSKVTSVLWKQPEPFADVLWNGDLSLRCYTHSFLLLLLILLLPNRAIKAGPIVGKIRSPAFGRQCHVMTCYVNFRRGGVNQDANRRGPRRIQDGNGRGTVQARHARKHTNPVARFLTGVQNQSSWAVGSETAAARGGAREGRPRQSKILRVASGG